MLILCVAGHHDCAGEQEIHEPIALDAGLSPLVIAQLRAGELPDLSSPRLKLLYRFAAELLSTHTVSDALFGEARTIFSEKQLVEVVGLVGYYSLVAYTLNAFGLRSAG